MQSWREYMSEKASAASAAIQDRFKYPTKEMSTNVGEALSPNPWNCSNTIKYKIVDGCDRAEGDRDWVVGQIFGFLKNSPEEVNLTEKWHQVFKTLALLEFLIKNVADYAFWIKLLAKPERREVLVNYSNLKPATVIVNGQDKGKGIREMTELVLKLAEDAEHFAEQRYAAEDQRKKAESIASKVMCSSQVIHPEKKNSSDALPSKPSTGNGVVTKTASNSGMAKTASNSGMTKLASNKGMSGAIKTASQACNGPATSPADPAFNVLQFTTSSNSQPKSSPRKSPVVKSSPPQRLSSPPRKRSSIAETFGSPLKKPATTPIVDLLDFGSNSPIQRAKSPMKNTQGLQNIQISAPPASSMDEFFRSVPQNKGDPFLAIDLQKGSNNFVPPPSGDVWNSMSPVALTAQKSPPKQRKDVEFDAFSADQFAGNNQFGAFGGSSSGMSQFGSNQFGSNQFGGNQGMNQFGGNNQFGQGMTMNQSGQPNMGINQFAAGSNSGGMNQFGQPNQSGMQFGQAGVQFGGSSPMQQQKQQKPNFDILKQVPDNNYAAKPKDVEFGDDPFKMF